MKEGECQNVNWVRLAQSGEQRRAVVNTTVNPGFYKRRRISWQDERLSASDGGLSCMQSRYPYAVTHLSADLYVEVLPVTSDIPTCDFP
jgi:hypothetical protein